MREFYAQGDVLIERVPDVPVSGAPLARSADGAVVVAEGGLTGHRHAIYGDVCFFRDDGLARDIPGGLYAGHLRVDAPTAELVHDEHDPITLERGTSRIRVQRELDPKEARIVAD